MISKVSARVIRFRVTLFLRGKQIGRKHVTKSDLPSVFMKYYPSYAGGTMTVTELARICNLSRPTAYKYINLIAK